MKKPYKVKEAFYSLQGEGAHLGRPAVFCRFSKCNLWNGKEEDRSKAICTFCDTDIVGTDGQNGGVFESPEALSAHLQSLWPKNQGGHLLGHPYIVFTGGEPALQLDTDLIDACHQAGFQIAIETNGTLPLPAGIDWVCVSPKSTAEVVVNTCDELKLVFPQEDAMPDRFDHITAGVRYLSPKANPLVEDEQDIQRFNHTQMALNYCLEHPQWRLTMQSHKLLGID